MPGVLRGLPVLLIVTAASAGPLRAQTPRHRIDVEAFHHQVSDDFGHWSGTTARLAIADPGRIWYFDARAQRAFRDEGVYAAITHVRDLSSGIYFSAGLGGGTGDFVLPDLRADGALHFKLGGARRVVLTVGGTYVLAKRGFEDAALSGGLTWYASEWAVIELGGRVNWSYPGAVRSARAQSSVTLGRPGGRTVIVRGSAGSEGYQLTGVAATLRRFDSQELEVLWREPTGGGWSVLVGGTWYHNQFYRRAGASLGFSRAW